MNWFNTCNTRILDKSLEVARFFEKKIILVHRYKPHEARFCAARFFSGTKNRVSRGLAVYAYNSTVTKERLSKEAKKV